MLPLLVLSFIISYWFPTNLSKLPLTLLFHLLLGTFRVRLLRSYLLYRLIPTQAAYLISMTNNLV